MLKQVLNLNWHPISTTALNTAATSPEICNFRYPPKEKKKWSVFKNYFKRKQLVCYEQKNILLKGFGFYFWISAIQHWLKILYLMLKISKTKKVIVFLSPKKKKKEKKSLLITSKKQKHLDYLKWQ